MLHVLAIMYMDHSMPLMMNIHFFAGQWSDVMTIFHISVQIIFPCNCLLKYSLILVTLENNLQHNVRNGYLHLIILELVISLPCTSVFLPSWLFRLVQWAIYTVYPRRVQWACTNTQSTPNPHQVQNLFRISNLSLQWKLAWTTFWLSESTMTIWSAFWVYDPPLMQNSKIQACMNS